MTWTVRPAGEGTEVQVSALVATCEPSCDAHLSMWRSAAEQTVSESLDTGCWSAFASQTGFLIGSAAFRHERFDKFRLSIIVHPRWRKQGVGTQLLAQLQAGLRASNARTVHVRVPEGAEEALRFYKKRGFEETQRVVELRLALPRFDPSAWQPLLQRFAEQGVTFQTMHDELRHNLQCWDQLQELQNAVLPDWPDFDPGPVQLLEGDAFRRQLESLNTIPEGFFIAKHDEQYVGYSGLTAPHDATPRMAGNAGTAFLGTYRKHHLATALKVCCLAYAKEYGYHLVMTGSANPAMLRINENLGFERHSAEVRLVKQLGQ